MGNMGEMPSVSQISPAERAANAKAREAVGAKNTLESITDDSEKERDILKAYDEKMATSKEHQVKMIEFQAQIDAKGPLVKTYETLLALEEADYDKVTAEMERLRIENPDVFMKQ